jgi:hypothetical protein
MSPNVIATLAQVVALVRLDEHEILWAIAEFGRCDCDDFEVLPSDDGDHFIVRSTR